ncbi:hypothetical protein DY251_03525 [Mesorhizobium denitrificans]|uniref:DUF4189 domain-containing protein n=1 Tax=Mesorhizobium denitrificans TaxID=2294114 RepID=A0A371XHM6_9HYPH|nr:hypothetical protein DY251_03525 [Mesorhizobium denitrificans]
MLCGVNNGFAENLSGKVGDKRYPVQFPMGEKDQCAKTYKQYIAVNNHAAYAQTAIAFPVEAFFCAGAVGSTKVEAEKEALKRCRSLFKRYKMTVAKNCQIYASK